jgi:guanosine-3',5'-bis(diphosphate) 3'-pyrophosphohydrolase
MNEAFAAMQFACHVHRGQKRKYTEQPYADHLAEVAGIVATVAHEITGTSWCSFEQMIAVAWLHDCREDQGVTEETLVEKFGLNVAYGVTQLSDLEVGNRATRKSASRARLSAAPGWVQTIKYADLISNTSSIVMHDPNFAGVYLEEKRLLLDVMTSGHPGLLALARDLCN